MNFPYICFRQSLYCVPVPGESFWVKELDGGGKRTEEEAMQTEGSVNTNANVSECTIGVAVCVE